MKHIMSFLLMLGTWIKYGVARKREREIIVVKWKRSLERMFLHPHMCSYCGLVNTL
jgi:hypothetical protein